MGESWVRENKQLLSSMVPVDMLGHLFLPSCLYTVITGSCAAVYDVVFGTDGWGLLWFALCTYLLRKSELIF